MLFPLSSSVQPFCVLGFGPQHWTPQTDPWECSSVNNPGFRSRVWLSFSVYEELKLVYHLAEIIGKFLCCLWHSWSCPHFLQKGVQVCFVLKHGACLVLMSFLLWRAATVVPVDGHFWLGDVYRWKTDSSGLLILAWMYLQGLGFCLVISNFFFFKCICLGLVLGFFFVCFPPNCFIF